MAKTAHEIQGQKTKENKNGSANARRSTVYQKCVRELERFGATRFMASDADMRFYAGLPDYQTLIALYNFLRPGPGFTLNYNNSYENISKDPSYIVSGGRP